MTEKMYKSKPKKVEFWWSNYWRFGKKIAWIAGKKHSYYRFGKIGFFVRGKK